MLKEKKEIVKNNNIIKKLQNDIKAKFKIFDLNISKTSSKIKVLKGDIKHKDTQIKKLVDTIAKNKKDYVKKLIKKDYYIVKLNKEKEANSYKIQQLESSILGRKLGLNEDIINNKELIKSLNDQVIADKNHNEHTLKIEENKLSQLDNDVAQGNKRIKN